MNIRIPFLTLFFLSAYLLGAQDQFNVVFDNPFIPNGGSEALGLHLFDDTLAVSIAIRTEDESTDYLFTRFSLDGQLIDYTQHENNEGGSTPSIVPSRFGQYATLQNGMVSNLVYFDGDIDSFDNWTDSVASFDNSGEINWIVSIIPDSITDRPLVGNGVFAYDDSRYVSFGITYDYPTVDPEIRRGQATMVDSLGNIYWHNEYPFMRNIFHGIPLSQGGSMLSGSQLLPGGGGTGNDATVLRIDSLGNELWRQVWANEGDLNDHEAISPVIELQDGRILTVCQDKGDPTYEGGSGPLRVQIIQDFGADGYEVEEDYLLDTRNGYKIVYNIQELNGEKIAMVGSSSRQLAAELSPFGQEEAIRREGGLYMISQDLDSLFFRHYSYYPHPGYYNEPIHAISDIVELPGGDLIMCGYAKQSSQSDDIPLLESAWIFRTDSLGCLEPGCQNITDLYEQVGGLDGSLTLYPNPVRSGEPLRLEFTPKSTAEMPYAHQTTQVLVHDLQGREVHREHIAPTRGNSGFLLEVDVPKLSRGQYILHWMNEAGVWYDGVQFVVE